MHVSQELHAFTFKLIRSRNSILEIVDISENGPEVLAQIVAMVADLEAEFHTRYSHFELIHRLLDNLPENERPPKLTPMPDFIKVYEVTEVEYPTWILIARITIPPHQPEVPAHQPEEQPPASVPVPEETVLPLAVDPAEWSEDTMSQESYSSAFNPPQHPRSP